MASKRIFFLDNLKFFIIWLMVIFHAGLCYMADAPFWWYVLNDERILAATALHRWADAFIMSVMFFISGYFGIMSLSKHGLSGFWRGKWLRIIIPWVFGSMLIAPPVSYIMIVSRDVPMGFWEYYTTLFWGPAYQQIQYWYLGVLLTLYLIMWLLAVLMPRLKERADISQPSLIFFAFLLLIGGGTVYAINSVIPDATWMPIAYIWSIQPTRVPLYIIFFFVGVYAWHRHWFETGGYVPHSGWIVAFALMSIVYLYYRFAIIGTPDTAPDTALPLHSFLFAALCISAVMGLCAIFQRMLDYTTPTLSSLAGTSYAVYYLHMFFVQMGALLIRPMSIHPLAKWLIVSALSLAICYFLSKYIMLKIPCFGGERK